MRKNWKKAVAVALTMTTVLSGFGSPVYASYPTVSVSDVATEERKVIRSLQDIADLENPYVDFDDQEFLSGLSEKEAYQLMQLMKYYYVEAILDQSQSLENYLKVVHVYEEKKKEENPSQWDKEAFGYIGEFAYDAENGDKIDVKDFAGLTEYYQTRTDMDMEAYLKFMDSISEMTVEEADQEFQKQFGKENVEESQQDSEQQEKPEQTEQSEQPETIDPEQPNEQQPSDQKEESEKPEESEPQSEESEESEKPESEESEKPEPEESEKPENQESGEQQSEDVAVPEETPEIEENTPVTEEHPEVEEPKAPAVEEKEPVTEEAEEKTDEVIITELKGFKGTHELDRIQAKKGEDYLSLLPEEIEVVIDKKTVKIPVTWKEQNAGNLFVEYQLVLPEGYVLDPELGYEPYITIEIVAQENLIVGFPEYEIEKSIRVPESEKEQVAGKLDYTVKATLDDGSTISIPVEWTCKKDILETKDSEYTYTAKFTSDYYELAEGLKMPTTKVYVEKKSGFSFFKAERTAGQWIWDGTGWWYKHTDGSYTVNAWEFIDNEWYYFNGSGYMATNMWVNGRDWVDGSGHWTKAWVYDGYQFANAYQSTTVVELTVAANITLLNSNHSMPNKQLMIIPQANTNRTIYTQNASCLITNYKWLKIEKNGSGRITFNGSGLGQTGECGLLCARGGDLAMVGVNFAYSSSSRWMVHAESGNVWMDQCNFTQVFNGVGVIATTTGSRTLSVTNCGFNDNGSPKHNDAIHVSNHQGSYQTTIQGNAIQGFDVPVRIQVTASGNNNISTATNNIRNNTMIGLKRAGLANIYLSNYRGAVPRSRIVVNTSGNNISGSAIGIFNYGCKLTSSGDTITNCWTGIQNGDRNNPSNASDVYLNGGTRIASCSASQNGGGIWNSGYLNISNATIESNHATSGGGIQNVSGGNGGGNVVITGGTIRNNSATYGGGIATTSTVTTSGANYTGNSATDGGAIHINNGASVTVNSGTFSGNKASNNGGAFMNWSGNLAVNNTTVSGNTASVYGGGIYNHSTLTLSNANISSNTANQYGGGILTDTAITFANGTIAGNKAQGFGGGIFANASVTLSGGTIRDNQAVTQGGGGVYVNYGNINLSGTNLTGNKAAQSGGAIATYAQDGKSLTITHTKGEISGNSATNGGAIALGNNVKLNLNGGTIKNNTATNSGGGVHISGTGNMTMNSGTISGNSAPFGGGIFNNGTLTLSNGTISGNNATRYGGGIYTDGPFTMNSGNIQGNTAQEYGGGVFTDTTVTLAGGTIQQNKAVTQSGGGVYLNYKTVNLKGTNITGNTAGNVGGGLATYAKDGEASAVISFTKGAFSGNTAKYGGGIYVGSNTKLTLNGGNIQNNTATGAGGGIHISAKGTATLTSGAISGNTANGGGGIKNEGTCTINGASITGNTANSSGGGIHNNGTVTLSSGKIDSNVSKDYAAGVDNGGTFKMTGGSISENKSTRYGAGFRMWGGTFNMTGGSITKNAAGTNGGGICINPATNYSPVANITGGTVSGNTAAELGAGVWQEGTLNMSGAAKIDTNNDVYLTAGKYITVPAALTGSGTLARITPSDYTLGRTCVRVTYSGANGGTVEPKYTLTPKDSYILRGGNHIPDIEDKDLVISRTYAVSYDANGGTGAPAAQQKYWKEDLKLSTTKPSRNGYTFAIWNTKADTSGTDYAPGATYKADADVTMYAKWTPAIVTNKLEHWAYGFQNSEGNNGNKTAFKLTDNQTFQILAGSKFFLDKGRATKIPNGFYLKDVSTPSITGEWKSYPIGTEVAQTGDPMRFNYNYAPENYKITYELGGGTNNSENPSTYNVLYGVDLKNPTRTGYNFEGWYEGTTKVTGINKGANATFSSATDLYNSLAARDTGDKTLTAKWTPKKIKVIFHRNHSKDDPTTKTQTFTYDVKGQKFADTGWTKTGFTHIGWSLNQNATKADYAVLSGVSNNWINTHYPEVHVYAVWYNNPPEITTVEKSYYEGQTVTKEMLMEDITASDVEDGDSTKKLELVKVEYAEGKLVDGVKQPGYTDTEIGDDYQLDTWFKQMEKDAEVSHKVTYKVTDIGGATTTKEAIVKVKYNNPPEITAEDQTFMLRQAQNGEITEEALLQKLIEAGTLKADDIEEGNLSERLELKDFDASVFLDFIGDGYYNITYTVTDTYGPDGVGKTTEKEVKVKIRGSYSREKDITVRFINKEYYEKNKDKYLEMPNDEETAVLNQNGGLQVQSKWYKDAAYKSVIEETFEKTTGTTYEYTKEDLDEMRQYVEDHGIGNAEEETALAGFSEKFMK